MVSFTELVIKFGGDWMPSHPFMGMVVRLAIYYSILLLFWAVWPVIGFWPNLGYFWRVWFKGEKPRD